MKHVARERVNVDIGRNTEIARLAERALKANESLVLRLEGEDVAILRPLKRSERRGTQKGEPTNASASYWTIMGIADGPDDGIHDVSNNKDKYLADAYASVAKKA